MQEIQIIKKINHFKEHYTEQTQNMRASKLELHSKRLILECESEILRLLRANANLRSKIRNIELESESEISRLSKDNITLRNRIRNIELESEREILRLLRDNATLRSKIKSIESKVL